MANQTQPLVNYSDWLVRRAGCRSESYAIAVDSSCPACQPPVGEELADYLNEFCDLPSLNCWHAFDQRFIDNIQEETLLNQVLKQPECPVRALAALGGCILEGKGLGKVTQGLPHVFQVCLCCHEPEDPPYHLHLNQKRFEPGKVVNIIGDAFLEWADGGGDPQFPRGLEQSTGGFQQSVLSLPQAARSQADKPHLI